MIRSNTLHAITVKLFGQLEDGSVVSPFFLYGRITLAKLKTSGIRPYKVDY